MYAAGPSHSCDRFFLQENIMLKSFSPGRRSFFSSSSVIAAMHPHRYGSLSPLYLKAEEWKFTEHGKKISSVPWNGSPKKSSRVPSIYSIKSCAKVNISSMPYGTFKYFTSSHWPLLQHSPAIKTQLPVYWLQGHALRQILGSPMLRTCEIQTA